MIGAVENAVNQNTLSFNKCPGSSTRISMRSPSYTLCPITNLIASPVTNAAYLFWTKPVCDSGLIGYDVYKNTDGYDSFHHYVPGPDSLSTYYYNLNWDVT